MKEPKYKVGDLVSVEKWDATERPPNRIGSPAKVLRVLKEWSETGWMYNLEGSSGRPLFCDQNWLLPWEVGLN